MICTFLFLLGLFNGQDSVNIDVWFNKDEPVYNPGENLKIFFRTDKDCYIAVYDIEVGGRENLLFPPEGESGMVRANMVYELPPEDADFDYEITGPEGTERIIILASLSGLPEIKDRTVIKKEIAITVIEPEPAKLKIISSPKRCRIYIESVQTGDEVYIGYTPRTIVLKPGEYIVRIKKAGYVSLEKRIKLEPDERRRVYVRLLPW
uniref:DUF4384 domain-containing protein n=1 Tax=candidate division WOR-3 bacterium TaxID=2052148 RepID=A0A7C4X9V2_UNCW3